MDRGIAGMKTALSESEHDRASAQSDSCHRVIKSSVLQNSNQKAN